jgi:prepilin-type N-terminal cleavage/methylation domain-containing protein/prepilin-type processing-associated H-X9-DG protein
MIYIHELESVLSSKFLLGSSFSLPLHRLPNIMGCKPTKPMAKNSRLARAFTLIELLVVIAVIAILITIAYPVYTGMLERGKATKDMNNLRQIGVATQTYMNDNDGVLPGSLTATWMSQLELNQKYLAGWRVLQSPFDGRAPSESGTVAPVSPISYGINANVYPGGAAISSDKITKPTAFILFAPAQAPGSTVTFQGRADSPAPGVRVLGVGGNAARSNPPGANAIGGTHNNRQRINALFADLHSETMLWTTFTNNAATGSDPDGYLRWNPF